MGAQSVAYTYTEPSVSYEYVMDIAPSVAEAGLLNVMHSNGMLNPGPLEMFCEVMDAANIDLKGFLESFYRELCGGTLAPVLESLKLPSGTTSILKSRIWLFPQRTTIRR